jgi:alpha-N-arabinofuranosidase
VLNDDGHITVFAVNRSLGETLPLSVALRGFKDSYTVEAVITLSHPDPKATNTEDNPDNVRPHAGCAAFEDGLLRADLAPLSWNVLRLKPQ